MALSSAYVTSIEGNRQLLDGGAMFGNVPRPLWERWIKPDNIGRIPLACRSLLIEFDGKKLLCETGIGAFFDPKMADRFGVQSPDRHLLLENLKAAGHSPDSIDYLILSHLHFDHAGGLLPRYGDTSTDLVFPKAKFIVGEEAWQRALKPHSRDKASFIPGLTEKLEASGRLIRIQPGSKSASLHASLPEPLQGRIEFIISHGHTPGQLLTLFKGAKQNVFFCGDLIPGSPWVHLPVTMGYDRYPEMLIDEKAELYRRAEKEQWLLFFTHDPDVSGAIVKKSDSGRYEPREAERVFSHLEI